MTHAHHHATGLPDDETAGVSEAPGVSKVGEISVVDVHKSFGATKALDGCTFNAHLGEIHAVIGGNGSGKSTLVKVLSGVLPIDSGQVSVLGHTPRSPYDARDIGIATVFQEVLVADESSIVDNLYLGTDSLWSHALPAREKVRSAAALMQELVGVKVDVEASVGTLPLSIKQRITIGRALLCKPKVLILDESSAALDLESTERLFAKMRALRDEGLAILIVTHRIAELTRISDRATVLRDGQDVGVLEKQEITEQNLLGLITGESGTGHVPTTAVRDVSSSQVVIKTKEIKVWPRAEGVDFSLHKGEVLGITGLDGQGHSEFVTILAGIAMAAHSLPLVKTDDGPFAEIRGLADADKYGIAYVSGDRKREGIFANLSIFENLLMPLFRRTAKAGKLAIIDWPTLSAAFDWEAKRLSVRMAARDNKITSLSGGNQQKILIGRAFALNPDILILNDPARGIDVGAKGELYEDLSAYAARGKSIIYLSSEIEEFLGFCTRVLVFRHGSVFEEFSDDEIDPDRILEAMFGKSRHARTAPVTQAEPNAKAAASPPRWRKLWASFTADMAESLWGEPPKEMTAPRPEVKFVDAIPDAESETDGLPKKIKVVDFSEAVGR